MKKLNAMIFGDVRGGFSPRQLLRVGNKTVRIERLLSEGGYAFVFLARDEATGQNYALKRMLVMDNEARRVAEEEIALLSALPAHPNIVSLVDHCKMPCRTNAAGGDDYLMLLEFAAGGHVVDLMNKRKFNRLSEREVLDLFLDVVRAVGHLHSQQPPIAHRDIKVENVLLHPSGKFMLCDFGSATTRAKVYDTKEERGSEEVVIEKYTTLPYRPPEMCDLYRRDRIDEKVDVWALGCMLYKLMYYVTPFEDGGTLAIQNVSYQFPADPPYGETLKGLVRYMLVGDPAERPDIFEVAARAAEIRKVPVPITRPPHYAQPPVRPLNPSGASTSAAAPAASQPKAANAKPSGHHHAASAPPSASSANSNLLNMLGGDPAPAASPASQPAEVFDPFDLGAGSSGSGSAAAQPPQGAGVAPAPSPPPGGAAVGAMGGGGRAPKPQLTRRERREYKVWLRKATKTVASTSTLDGGPKAKYVRRLVIKAWEAKSAMAVLHYADKRVDRLQRSGGAGAAIGGWKLLLVLLKMLQQGPPPTLVEAKLHLAPLLARIEALGGQSGAYAPIHAVAEVVRAKLAVHALAPELEGNYSLDLYAGEAAVKHLPAFPPILEEPRALLLVLAVERACSTAHAALQSPSDADAVLGREIAFGLVPVVREAFAAHTASVPLLNQLFVRGKVNGKSKEIAEFKACYAAVRNLLAHAEGVAQISSLLDVPQLDARLPTLGPRLAANFPPSLNPALYQRASGGGDRSVWVHEEANVGDGGESDDMSGGDVSDSEGSQAGEEIDLFNPQPQAAQQQQQPQGGDPFGTAPFVATPLQVGGSDIFGAPAQQQQQQPNLFDPFSAPAGPTQTQTGTTVSSQASNGSGSGGQWDLANLHNQPAPAAPVSPQVNAKDSIMSAFSEAGRGSVGGGQSPFLAPSPGHMRSASAGAVPYNHMGGNAGYVGSPLAMGMGMPSPMRSNASTPSNASADFGGAVLAPERSGAHTRSNLGAPKPAETDPFAMNIGSVNDINKQ